MFPINCRGQFTAAHGTYKHTPLTPQQQEALRRQAIAATVDQRINNLQFQQSLTADRRFGADPNEYDTNAAEVKRMWTDPAARGNGVGSAVLDAIID